jgi:hypothetical protein
MQVLGGYCSMTNLSLFRSLAAFLVLAFILVSFQPAEAQTSPDIFWSVTVNGARIAGSTPDIACKGYISKVNETRPIDPYSFVDTERINEYAYRCNGKTPKGSSSQLSTIGRQACTTASPYFDPVSQACVVSNAPPQAKCDVPEGGKITWYGKTGVGSMDSESSDAMGFPTSSPTCYLSGVAEVKGCYKYEIAGPKYQYACKFEGVSTGQPVATGQGPEVATPPAPASNPVTTPPFKAPDDKSCPRGTVNVGLSASGIPMCIGQGTDPKNTPAAPPKVEVEKNETLPDGSTQNTKSVTTKNADGSTTTVKTVTVTKPTGEKETTQDKNTTATPGGKPGKETETPEKQNDLCKQNPNLAICKNSTVGGKCGETTCMGDAIQCATLRATAILQCKAEKDELDLKASPLAAKGQSAMDGSDMEGLPGPKNGLVVNVASMKAEGWLGNGAAFEDVSFSLQGHEVLMPLSKWSSYLLPLRYVMMIIASMISYRILAGAVLKE